MSIDLTKVTLAKALKMRKSLANLLATASARIKASAVVKEGSVPDFLVAEQESVFLQSQAELRELKTITTEASMRVLVVVPDNLPFLPESGKMVPVYQAVLIRDDLKAYASLLKGIIDLPAGDSKVYSNSLRDFVEQKKERQFDFKATLALIDKVQDTIDELDASIQYVDATYKVGKE